MVTTMGRYADSEKSSLKAEIGFSSLLQCSCPGTSGGAAP